MLADEVYWAISYDRPHASILDFDGMPARTVLLDGWSKTFAMTGWRLGFGVFPIKAALDAVGATLAGL